MSVSDEKLIEAMAMDELRWYPTGRIRYVVTPRGDFYLQQEWLGSKPLPAFGAICTSDWPADQRQWRVIEQVREADLTPEELGITKAADLPADIPND